MRRNTPRIILFLALLSLFAQQILAQTHLWSQSRGIAGRDIGWDVAVDASNNVFIVGAFADSIDLGGGPFASAGSWDVFIAKFDSDGNHVWSRAFGDRNSDRGLSVVADGSGNVIIFGTFQDSVDFGGGTLVSGDAFRDDVFLAKYDATGTHLWSQSFGGFDFEYAGDVAVDAGENVVITGAFRSPTDFGGGPLTTNGFNDVFLARFNAAGGYLWSKRFGGSVTDHGLGVAIDVNGKILLTGFFQQTANFGGGPLVSTGDSDIFVAKYNPGGAHVWSQRYGTGANATQEGHAIAVDGSGNVVVTGLFGGTVNFGGGALTNLGSGVDIFLAHLDASGAHNWSKRFGGPGPDIGSSVAVDGDNNVLLTGFFDGTADFGGGAVASVDNSEDVFVAQYDLMGTHLWSQTFGGDWDSDRGEGIVVDGGGNILFTGQFRGIVDFGGGPFEAIPNGNTDAFLAKYGDTPTGLRPPIPSPVMSLAPVYPNPFNPLTHINYSVERAAHVTVTIYDASGRYVVTLVDERVTSGPHVAEWNGRNANGLSVPSGVYFIRLATGREVLSRKAVLLK